MAKSTKIFLIILGISILVVSSLTSPKLFSGVTVLTTDTTDTFNTFRTNVNTSLTDLATNINGFSTTTANIFTALQTFSVGFLSTASSTIGAGGNTTGLTINGGATTTGTHIFQSLATMSNLLLTGSTTLQSFTATNSTTTSATTTNSYSTTASSTNLFSTTGAVGSLYLTTLGISSTTPYSSLSVGSGYSITVGENRLSTSTSMTIDWNAGNQQLVQKGTAGITLTFSNVIDGKKLTIVGCNPGAGTAGTFTWPSNVYWPGGAAPSQTTTANKCDLYTFAATKATSTTAIIIFGGYNQAY